MIYAQIKNGVIVNTIELEDPSILNLFMADPVTDEPYDSVRLIEHLYPRPGIGWTFNEIIFIPPVVIDEEE